MPKLDDYFSLDEIAWCPACGNFKILDAVKQAFVDLKIEPWRTAFVSGIGQAAKLPHYLKCNLFNGLHGRTLPVATGVKLANSRLVVIAEGGDGDGFAEGGNHAIAAMRRNVDLTWLLHDNQVYGLTKGQVSPTSEKGFHSTTTPDGSYYPPVNVLALAIALDAGFVARAFSGDQPHLTWTIKQAIEHKGFALVDILQNCVSFNKVNTFGWYRQRVYKLNDDPKYDASNRQAAFAKAQEWGDKIPTGVIYRSSRPALDSALSVTGKTPLVDQPIDWRKRGKLVNEFK